MDGFFVSVCFWVIMDEVVWFCIGKESGVELVLSLICFFFIFIGMFVGILSFEFVVIDCFVFLLVLVS